MARARFSALPGRLLLVCVTALVPTAVALAAEQADAAAAEQADAAAVEQADPAAVQRAEAAARQVMEQFLEAFNARDEAAWADTLNYPHVRIASGTVAVFPDRAAFIDNRDLAQFAADTGWDYSTWDDMQIVHASPDKVHIAVTFTRYDQQGSKMATYDSFYVIDNVDGHWGVRARSSFAP